MRFKSSGLDVTPIKDSIFEQMPEHSRTEEDTHYIKDKLGAIVFIGSPSGAVVFINDFLCLDKLSG
jgi:hypothetical protein